MCLLVDIGNSRLKWAEKQHDRISASSAFILQESSFYDELEQGWGRLDAPVRVLVANVAKSNYINTLADWVQAHWQLDIEQIQSQAQAFGVTNGYKQPLLLGIDRWLALIAARYHFQLPACIIDCGTAATVDVLDQHGIHLGGVIAPGLRLMQDALIHSTQAIEESIRSEFQVLATDTDAAVNSGAVQALVGMAERLIQHAQQQSGRDITVIFTGGDAETVAQFLPDTIHISPDLILHGLAVIADNS